MTLLMDTCLVCGNETEIIIKNIFDTRFGIEGYYNIARCRSCRLEQLSPKPTNKELVKLYQEHYNFIEAKDGKYKSIRERFLSSIFYKFWIYLDGDVAFHTAKGKGRLLDVGCNEGRGLEIYQKNGYSVEGLEINLVAAQTALNKGFKVFSDSLEAFRPVELYDVVVITNVLEHSLVPNGMLGNINGLLNSGGQVWISCPNGQSWYRKLFGKYWINWHPPFHISHFSRESLTKLLLESGFEICSIKNETPSLWLAQSLIAALYAKHGRITRHLRYSWLVGGMMLSIRLLLFPLLWLGNRISRGDCLVVVAKKR